LFLLFFIPFYFCEKNKNKNSASDRPSDPETKTTSWAAKGAGNLTPLAIINEDTKREDEGK